MIESPCSAAAASARMQRKRRSAPIGRTREAFDAEIDDLSKRSRRVALDGRLRGRAIGADARRRRSRPIAEGRAVKVREVGEMYERFGLFIGGELAAGRNGAKAPVISPVTESRSGRGAGRQRRRHRGSDRRGRARPRRRGGRTPAFDARRRAARDRRRDDPPHGRGGADDLDRDRQADRAGGARMGAACRPVPLVRRGGAPHLRPHRREPRARRTLRGHARAGRRRRRLHGVEFPGGADRAQGGAGACGRLLGHRAAVDADAGHGDGDGRLLPRRQPAGRRRQSGGRADGGDLCADHGVARRCARSR